GTWRHRALLSHPSWSLFASVHFRKPIWGKTGTSRDNPGTRAGRDRDKSGTTRDRTGTLSTTTTRFQLLRQILSHEIPNNFLCFLRCKFHLLSAPDECGVVGQSEVVRFLRPADCPFDRSN